MKIRNLFVLAAAATFALAGCSNEPGDDKKPAGGDGNLFIQFSMGKAVAEPVSDGEPISFTKGGLFFTNDSESILKFILVSNDVSGALTVNQLTNGTLIENVPAEVTRLYIIGNYPFETIDNGNIDLNYYKTMYDVRQLTIDLEGQSDSKWGVSNANLYGSDVVRDATPAEKATYNADKMALVEVRAVPARFEIKSLKGDTDIDSYTLAGIYINNFYYTVDLMGGVVPDTHYNYSSLVYPTPFNENQQWWKYFRDDATIDWMEGSYKKEWYQMLFDDGGLGNTLTDYGINGLGDASSVSKVVEPGSGKMWAYNFFPVANATPHIVLHLTNVSTENGVENETIKAYNALNPTKQAPINQFWLTVRTYHEDSTNGGVVSFEGGKVYRLDEIFFMESDLAETPEPEPENEVKVYVRAELIPWKVVNVIGGF